MPTTDSGFVIAGTTTSKDGNVYPNKGTEDGWIIKTDKQGNMIWQRTIGGLNSEGLWASAGSQNSIFAAGWSSSSETGDIYKKSKQKDVMIVKIGTGNAIQGIVFFDANGNGIKEPGERLIDNMVVKSIAGSIERLSMASGGQYGFTVDTGKFITGPVVKEGFRVARADTTTFSNYDNIKIADFAIQPVGIKTDLQVHIIPVTRARPGFETEYQISFRNNGNVSMSQDTVVFVKDYRQSFVRSTPGHTYVKGDSLFWIIPRLEPLQSPSFIQVTVNNRPPPQLNIGDSLFVFSAIYPITDDAAPDDNRQQLSQTVVGSFDPNDKTEAHGGRITPEQLANKEALSYLIRFQNTGTDTAFRVIIRDTLENKLDWNTFEMMAASHPYQLSIENRNILVWTFNNIQLPDSNVNEKKSHGFVSYRMKPVAGLQLGDSIINKAAIYFDFNLPVITNRSNTTVRTRTATNIGNPALEGLLYIYPNPATTGDLYIRILQPVKQELRLVIREAAGRNVWEKNYGMVDSDNFSDQLNIKTLQPGVYFLQVQIGSKETISKFIKL